MTLEPNTQRGSCLLDEVAQQSHGTDQELKRVRGGGSHTILHTVRGVLAADDVGAGHEGPLGSDSAAHDRGRGRAAGRSGRSSRADQRLAGGGLSGLSGTGAVGGGGSRRAGRSAGLGGIRGGGDLGTGLEQTRVVGLAVLGDLEGIVVALLDVFTGSPGEGPILGLVGDGLDILQVAGIALAEGESDGLDNSSAD